MLYISWLGLSYGLGFMPCEQGVRELQGVELGHVRFVFCTSSGYEGFMELRGGICTNTKESFAGIMLELFWARESRDFEMAARSGWADLAELTQAPKLVDSERMLPDFDISDFLPRYCKHNTSTKHECQSTTAMSDVCIAQPTFLL